MAESEPRNLEFGNQALTSVEGYRVCTEGHHGDEQERIRGIWVSCFLAQVGQVGTVESGFVRGVFRKPILGYLDTWYGHLGIIHQNSDAREDADS